MKTKEFHISFIGNLVFIAFVTLASMISARLFIRDFYPQISNPQQYTSQGPYSEVKAAE